MGTTERSLQREFFKAYRVTPLKWARCLALHRVREQLRTSDGRRFTVEGIASEWGFRHKGRFAGYCQELFRESRSETLRKA